MGSIELFLKDFLSFMKRFFFAVYDTILRPKILIKNVLLNNKTYISPTLYLFITITFLHTFFVKRETYSYFVASEQLAENFISQIGHYNFTENLFYAIPIAVLMYSLIKSILLFFKRINRNIYYIIISLVVGSYIIGYFIIYHILLFFNFLVPKIYELESFEFQMHVYNIFDMSRRYLVYIFSLVIIISSYRFVKYLKSHTLERKVFLLPLVCSLFFFAFIRIIYLELKYLYQFFPDNMIEFSSNYPSFNVLDIEERQINDSINYLCIELIVSNNSEYTCYLKSQSPRQLLFHNGKFNRTEFYYELNRLDFRFKDEKNSYFVLNGGETKPIRFESKPYIKSKYNLSKYNHNKSYLLLEFQSLNPNFTPLSSTEYNLQINGLKDYEKMESNSKY